MEETDKQVPKQNYDWLKPWQFQKGISGNPAGRPPGKSLKTFVKEMLELMSPEEKIDFLKHLDPNLVWKMAEGMPEQKSDMTSGGKPIPLFSHVSNNDSDKQNPPLE